MGPECVNISLMRAWGIGSHSLSGFNAQKLMALIIGWVLSAIDLSWWGKFYQLAMISIELENVCEVDG